MKDKWEKTVGDVTVTYATQGGRSEGYVHDCECQFGKFARSASMETRGNQLSREEIENLPRFVELVERCEGKPEVRRRPDLKSQLVISSQ